MKPEIFEYHLSVPKSAIDDMHHANNIAYLQWVQEAAKKHWESKTDKSTQDRYAWVVLDHYINYHQPAFLNDKLTVKTWVKNHNGAKSERHTKIINTTTQKVLVSAVTHWCLLLKKTLKPIRIKSEISTLFLDSKLHNNT